MHDAELLATYLRRRYRGRVEILLNNKKRRVVLVYKRRCIEFHMTNGEVEIHYRLSVHSPPKKTKFHMANPVFKEEFDKFLLDGLRLRLSKLKAEY